MAQRFLEGKAALVTAGSRNLGAAIAEALAMRGAAVAVNYRRSGAEAEELVDRLGRHGSGHAAVGGDAGSPAGVRALVAAARRALGDRAIQVLVNNYGPFSMTPFAEMPPEEFDRIWDSNVKAAYVAVRDGW
jgi:3-oxoacyl-[acyl-carrier protein] reductase